MEGVLVSAAAGALNSVLEKLGTLLVNEYNLHKGVRGEIKSLTDELTAMHAFLLKMSEEEDPNVQDKVCLATVRELSYDIEDSIDDFMQDETNKEVRPDGFISKIKHILGKLGKRKADHKIFQDLKKQVIEAGKRNARYNTRQAFSNTKNATIDPRAFAIFEHASKLVGIDESKSEVIKLLTEGASTGERLKLVSIVGSGGVGKTTLANQVYQDLKERFECRAFLSVSRNPNMMNIMRTIHSQVSGLCFADTEAGSIQQVIINISCFLSYKRYFVVIDDIWDVDAWNVIKFAFPMTEYGGVIITTTRMGDVACLCRSSIGGHIYNIQPLNMVHSRQLFHRRLFNSEEDCPSSLEMVSSQILEKCDGLPLAIIAISSLLANIERTEHRWSQVKDSIGRALERNPSVKGMIKILSLSYFDLPPHLKTCLLYLSIFPEDSIIEKKGLIRRWIAEGFVYKDSIYKAFELGERYFNELINRSLIQPVKLGIYGEVRSCRVHDTILDFIVSKSIEENFVTFIGVPSLPIRAQGRVRRLSMQVQGEGNHVMPMTLVLSHVRSLNVFADIVEIPSMMEFRHLRSMDFGGCNPLGIWGCRQLENHHLANVGRLFQLRYLNISVTHVSKLPEQIGDLQCLEMLDIRETEVHSLPAGIVNLRKLKHLLVGNGLTFPDQIAKMQALEILKCVDISSQSYKFLEGLGQLKNLRKLHLYFEDIEEYQQIEVTASSLRNLGTHNLSSLKMEFLDDNTSLDTAWCTSPPLNLQKLGTTYCLLPKVPDWVKSLANLQKLRLQVERIRDEDLCILGALPALLMLNLEGAEDQTPCEDRRLTVSAEAGFKCLSMFNYFAQGDGMDLVFAAGCMPKLEKLVIVFYRCSEKETLSSSPGALDFGMENLSSLLTFECQLDSKINKSTVGAVKASLERAVGAHPNKHLTLIFKEKTDRYW
ncbi:unnamed protein product [Triticum turgidum subsp. durum]|uniref:Disease resistance protein RPM1 n=1 Tax=Triticum turgidum subsp. durum TaxID=4567 RepID=A0A9R1BGC8_TRITD|nr:unnamed protein product [Triticum turgidum subsp. durum]